MCQSIELKGSLYYIGDRSKGVHYHMHGTMVLYIYIYIYIYFGKQRSRIELRPRGHRTKPGPIQPTSIFLKGS